jgi:hypothetical protein
MKTYIITEKIEEVILAFLFLVYLVLNPPLPSNLARFLQKPFGKGLVIILSVTLFFMSNPILGVLGFLIAFDLIIKASQNTVSYDVVQSNNDNFEQMLQINTEVNEMQQKSLEHFIVKQMAPIPYSNAPVPMVYPLVDNLYDATPIDSKPT